VAFPLTAAQTKALIALGEVAPATTDWALATNGLAAVTFEAMLAQQ